MGISPGWKDVYGSLALVSNGLNVSNVQPGKYQIAARVDPNNVIVESDESNNSYKFLPYTLPGFLAKAVTTPQTGAPATVMLASRPVRGPRAEPGGSSSARRRSTAR